MNLSPARFIQSALFILCLFTSVGTAHAQDITSNLTAHWKMDDLTGTNAENDVVSYLNGTMYGGMTGANSTAPGAVDTGLAFDGIDDYIRIENSSSVMPTFPFTVSAWVKRPSGATGNFWLVGAGNSFGIYNGFAVDIRDTGQIGTVIGGGTTSCGVVSRRTIKTSTTPFTNNAWNHIVVVFNSLNDRDIYVNDVLQAMEAGTGGASTIGYASGYKLAIGGSPNYGCGSPSYNVGSIDDLRIYKRALSAADVTALYAYTGLEYTCSAPDGVTGETHYNADEHVLQYCNGTEWVAASGPKVLPDVTTNLVAHYKLDDKTGTVAVDNTGTKDGTMAGGLDAANDSVPGLIKTAITFDGTDDRIENAYNPNFTGGEWTVSAWFKSTATTGVHTIIGSQFGTTGDEFQIYYHRGNDRIEIQIGDADSVGTTFSAGPTGLFDGEWHHVLVSGVHLGTLQIYVDNVLRRNELITNSQFTNNINPPAFAIGAFYGNATYSNFFEGELDDVRVYDRVLNSGERDIIYGTGAPQCSAPDDGLLAHWKLDETSGTTAADSSGNGNTGTVVPGIDPPVESVTGKDGQAFNINPGEYVDVGQMSSMIGLNQYTMAFWMRPDIVPSTGGDNDAPLMQHDDFDNQMGCRFDGTNQNFTCYMESGGSVLSTGAVSNGGNFAPFTWVHVVYTYESNNKSAMYLNGNLVSSRTHSSPRSVPNYSTTMRIGAIRNTSTATLDGRLDDVRIYNRALSSTEIAQLYGAVGGTCTTSNCLNPFGLTAETNFNTDHNVMQYCNGAEWMALAGSCPPATPLPSAGHGYFVLTEQTWNGSLSGITGARNKCISELRNTFWKGKSKARLTSENVEAFLCINANIGTDRCNQLMPNTTYYFAKAGDNSVGGAAFTTQSNGYGPNDTANWSGANYFGGNYTYWTGHRNNVSTSRWSQDTSSSDRECTTNWTNNDPTNSAYIGRSNRTDDERWASGTSSCNNHHRLICIVNP